MCANYYNDSDPFVCRWLRNLIDAGLIPDGVVDNRSILEVQADDVRDFTQVHLFCGIAGWPLALKLAGWPSDRPIWTGSCPCQPFSVAGKRRGAADSRHLWPEMYRLIGECGPATVVGEQVASKDGRVWLAGVRADLEALGYGVGAADLCAAGVGAPHIRQRLYWVADSNSRRREQCNENQRPVSIADEGGGLVHADAPERLGDANDEGPQRRRFDLGEHANQRTIRSSGELSGLGDSGGTRRQSGQLAAETGPQQNAAIAAGSGHWSNYDLVPCLDGKTRRVESGVQPLAHGVPARMGKLRAYGNAIVPPLAAEFLKAFMQCGSGGVEKEETNTGD